MTTSSGLSGGIASPTAPERGSFPLDHLSECRAFARAYHKCLQKSNGAMHNCRREARAYLECRMKRGLMAEEGWDSLGLSKDSIVNDEDNKNSTIESEKGSFIAGAKLAKRRKERWNSEHGGDDRSGGGDSSSAS